MEPIKRCKPPDWVRTVERVIYGIIIFAILAVVFMLGGLCVAMSLMSSFGDSD